MSGNFPPDYFAPDYFAPEYFGGETNANAISASIAGVASVTATLTSGQVNIQASLSGSASVVALLSAAGLPQEQAPARGGDDAPRGHAGIKPRLLRDRKRRIGVEVEEVAALYDRVMGLVPDKPTKAQKRVIKTVEKAVEPYREPQGIDFAALEADVRAVAALQAAHDRLVRDEEEAVIALLLAA